jgi:large subunit ribosomal protein L23
MKQIIIRPIITEKSLLLASQGTYAFAVAKLSTKKQIAASMHDMYGVHVTGVHTISMHGKSRRFNGRAVARPAIGWKKALVAVKKGETIEAFELKTEEPVTK